jgi:hypothetical protein
MVQISRIIAKSASLKQELNDYVYQTNTKSYNNGVEARVFFGCTIYAFCL